MSEAQKILEDNQDNLEKKAGSLSLDERKSLDSVKLQNNVVKNAQETKFQVQTKEGRYISVSAKVLMEAIARGVALAEGTNYKQKLQSANIRLKVGNNLYSVDTNELGRGSELMAFLQVAAGGNLVPDGKFGQATADAFSKFVSQSENMPESIKSNPEYIDSDNLFNQNIRAILEKSDKQTTDLLFNEYKVFQTGMGKDGYLYGQIDKKEERILIGYASKYNDDQYGKMRGISFSYSDVADLGKGINSNKLLNIIDSKIKANEITLKQAYDKEVSEKNAKNLEKSAENILDNLKLSDIKNPLVKEFLENKQSFDKNHVDFDLSNGRNNGINIEKGQIIINMPGLAIKQQLATYKKANNTFDGTKFLNYLTNKMMPLAKSWKQEQIITTFKKYVAQKPGPLEINDVHIIDEKKSGYTGFQEEVAEAKSQGVVVDLVIDQHISRSIDQLNKQKNYLVVKNWFDKDLVKFEKAANASGKDRLSKQEEETLSQLAKFQYENLLKGGKIIALKLSPRVVYSQVGRQKELSAYLERYKKVAIQLD